MFDIHRSKCIDAKMLILLSHNCTTYVIKRDVCTFALKIIDFGTLIQKFNVATSFKQS
jgi:hypothetical protein